MRDAAINYWTRVVIYIILRFSPRGIAYERVKFTPWGKPGGLEQVIAGIIKDFSAVTRTVGTWLQRAKIKTRISPKDWKRLVVSVKAAGTSQVDIDEAGRAGPVDRRASVDWGYSLARHQVIDSHLLAAGMIARRHPLIDAKTKVRIARATDPDPLEVERAKTRIITESVARVLGIKEGEVWWYPFKPKKRNPPISGDPPP